MGQSGQKTVTRAGEADRAGRRKNETERMDLRSAGTQRQAWGKEAIQGHLGTAGRAERRYGGAGGASGVTKK